MGTAVIKLFIINIILMIIMVRMLCEQNPSTHSIAPITAKRTAWLGEKSFGWYSEKLYILIGR